MKTKKSIAIVLALLLGMTTLGACNQTGNPGSSSSSSSGKAEASNLVTYNSYKALQTAIEKSLKAANASGRRYGLANDMMKTTAEMSPQRSSGQDGALQDYSKTNLQVAGVDEADIAKTDGTYLYIIANGRFIIVDARNPAQLKIVSQIQYLYVNEPAKNTIMPIEMYLDVKNNRITIISYTYDDRQTIAMLTEAAKNPSAATKSGAATGSKEAMIAPDYMGYYGQQNVLAQVIDLADIAKPAVVRAYSQEGSYLSSRRIDEYVYIVTNKYLNIYGEKAPNKDFYIPATKDSKGSGAWEMLPVASIRVVPNQQDNSFLVLSSLDTLDLNKKAQTLAVLGAGQNIYASTSNIYIASARYIYDEKGNSNTGNATAGTKTAIDLPAVQEVAPQTSASGNTADPSAGSGVTKQGEAAAPSDAVTSGNTTAPSDAVTSSNTAVQGDVAITVSKDAFRSFPVPNYTIFTDIYRFGIDKGNITDRGAGAVNGYILNQFAMDEYNGYFRVATTTGDTWRSDEYTSMNHLYVLDQSLKVVGKVEGLATRETIKSVRFTGNKAYMVTFRTVDPLFVLDLTDPVNPVVKGELKIPGYSEYLHPVSDTILIGFGKDAFEEKNMAYYLGMKISVFDVSDVANPKEISKMTIGDRGTTSEILTNHKALLYSAEKNIIGFPITIHQVPDSQKGDKHAYGMPTFVGYMVLGLTKDNQIYEKGRITHFALTIPEGYTPYYMSKEAVVETEKKIGDSSGSSSGSSSGGSSPSSSPRSSAWSEYDRMWQNAYLYNVSRGLFIGDTLFTVSNAIVKANMIKDFTDIGKMDVPGFEEMTKNYYVR